MGTASSGEWIAILLYFALVIGVGVYFFFRDRHQEGEKEYFLGGRGLGPWLTALSAEASDMSGWLLMGLPGVGLKGYVAGFSPPAALGVLLNWWAVRRATGLRAQIFSGAPPRPLRPAQWAGDQPSVPGASAAPAWKLSPPPWPACCSAACSTWPPSRPRASTCAACSACAETALQTSRSVL